MVGISKYSISIDSIGHQKQSVYEESVNLVLSISPIFLLAASLPRQIGLLFCRCHFKNNHPAYKKQRNCSHSDIYLSGKLRDETDHGCSKERSPLSAYVHKSKIFTWFFRWYDLGKIGSGKRLNSSLKHPDQNRHDPKLPLCFQKYRKHGNSKICCNTDGDQCSYIITFG